MSANKFKLYSHDDAAAHSLVINVNELEYYTWIELPHHIAKFLSLYAVYEFNTPQGPKRVEHAEHVVREGLRPWLRLDTAILNTEPGFHLYKFHFVDTRNDDMVGLYCAYNLQNDNPDKTDYIYMKNGNAEGFNPFVDGEGAGSASNDSISDDDTSSDTDESQSTQCKCCCNINCCNHGK